jgi:N-acetylglucosamine-6-phosphate deacetylase
MGKRSQRSIPENGFPAPDTRIVDALGKKVIPGLIDTHIHGAGRVRYFGRRTSGAARYLATQGITSFLPSTHL